MTPKDLDYIRDTIECEGFDYAFVDYSDFVEIDDATFHEKREKYLQARAELASYLNVDA